MKNYEATCLFDPALGEEKIDSLLNKFESKIKAGSGELIKISKWGKRRIAYTLPKKKSLKEAFYALIDFKGDKITLSTLEESIKYAEGIIRYRIICAKPQSFSPAALGKEIPGGEQAVEVSPDILVSDNPGKEG